jgi:hypothetical protein
MEQVEISHHTGFTPQRLIFTLLLSVGLHLLLLMHMSDWFQSERDKSAPSTTHKPLHITITAARTQETKHQQIPLIAPEKERSSEQIPPRQKESIDKVETTTEPNKERTITAAQIKQSAAAIARELADDDKKEQGLRPDSDSVSAILERALNKPRETPGIYSQADGASRIVTEKGFTYCIKPLDDWRFIGPEDNMPISTYCN